MKLFFLILFFLGCATKEAPNWYINTPKDNSLYIYASADGYSKQEAIDNALNLIASKLKVKISSTLNLIKSQIQNNYSTNIYKNISQNITTKIDNFTFYNYVIDKIKKINDKYYVVVKINRIKTAQKILNSIKERLSVFKTYSYIENLKNLNLKIKELRNLKKDYEIAKLLDPKIENIKINNKIQKYENELKKISLNVYSNSKELKEDVLSHLSKFTISKTPKIKIFINLKQNTNKIVGEYSTRTEVTIKVVDKSTQKIFKSNCLTLSFDKDLSKKIGLKKCEEKIFKFLDKIFGN
jgi:hypothetical protein